MHLKPNSYSALYERALQEKVIAVKINQDTLLEWSIQYHLRKSNSYDGTDDIYDPSVIAALKRRNSENEIEYKRLTEKLKIIDERIQKASQKIQLINVYESLQKGVDECERVVFGDVSDNENEN
jgi:hypothetical protein